MRTLLSTAASNAPFAAHRATTNQQKQQVIQNYHRAMLVAGLGPYNGAWHLIDYAHGGGSKMMEKFWTGGKYILPAEVADELARWKGHAFMLQHISQTIYNKGAAMRVAGVLVDDPAFVTKAAPFYAAAEDTIRNLGLIPYIMFDEPGATGATATRIMRVAEAVRRGSTMSVGPATSAAKAVPWLALDPPFNWWIIRNVGFTDAEGGTHFDPRMAGAERWTYYTTGMIAERIPRLIASAIAQGAVGLLTWTVYKWLGSPAKWSPDTCDLFDFPEGGNAFDPNVVPNEKLALLSAAVKGTVITPPVEPPPIDPPPPVALDHEQRIAKLEAMHTGTLLAHASTLEASA